MTLPFGPASIDATALAALVKKGDTYFALSFEDGVILEVDLHRCSEEVCRRYLTQFAAIQQAFDLLNVTQFRVDIPLHIWRCLHCDHDFRIHKDTTPTACPRCGGVLNHEGGIQ